MFLNCHSYYSLRFGTLSPLQVAEGAFAADVETAVLSDINNTAGIPEFYFACRRSGVKPIAGVDIRNKDNSQLFVLIAKNNEGLAEINRYLTEINQSKRKKTELPQFNNVFVIIPLENVNERNLAENEYIGVRPSQVKSLLSSPFTNLIGRMLMLVTVSFRKPSDFELCRNLRAVDNNILISQLPEDIFCSMNEIFVHPKHLREIYADYPQIIVNTIKLLNSCSLFFDNQHKNKKLFTGSFSEDIRLLRKLSLKGFDKRYGHANRKAAERMRGELQIIEKMGFVSYFLIAHDIVRYAQSKGYFYVGRGSGANSIVAYCLGITDVDPIELNLYFERFLNPKRSSPPDFDIDFSWRDRDDVISYIFIRFGSEHAALLGAMSTFKSRSILRELGKVQGLPKEELDILAKNPASVKDKDEIHRRIIAMAAELSGFPNLRTIHAGGIIISEKPICYYTATDMPPKGFPTTQWDMYVAEDLGFEKFDILSQRGLGHIRDCVEIVSENRNVEIDIREVKNFKRDIKVNQFLSTGNTIGCFYIESPAMRGLITKLECQDYLTLVAASSIIRPGVAKSGMMKEYIIRYNNPENVKYLHPVMEEQLGETYGVMVYQEDVLKVCHHYAGMDLADADVLRRAMSGKFRSRTEFDKIREKFFELCQNLNRPEDISLELWRQIESFAGYSFSKAHSASYAVESYQSLYLKTYYPLEFMTAVINNFGGFYSTWVYFHEAKRLGATINLPCINEGDYLTTIKGRDIFVGFIHIQSLEQALVHQIIKERNENGKFQSVEDFLNRCHIPDQQLNILIRVGAFCFTGYGKAELMWKSVMRKSEHRTVVYAVQK
ncbi:MAG: DNA polymerase III subunit alpha, partial [Bacteroidales bacterium]|nr:DNA polymerase III subunit alpha [Bacteroidales bacterium]